MNGFELFPRLPEPVRLNIWKHAASVPRIVGFHEEHHMVHVLDDNSIDTSMVPTTRPPAMLSVCQESRALGLEIYERIDEGMKRRPSSRDIPIYANPSADIIYRGKLSCRKGDMFQIRCRDWTEESAPLAMTRTLAIDAMAVTRQRPPYGFSFDSIREIVNSDEEAKIFMEKVLTNLKNKTMEEVSLCREKGLQDIIIVVGNDDDLSEIILVPLHSDHAQRSDREVIAVTATEIFKQDLADYWASKGLPSLPPKLTVMTVQRTPLKNFTLFPLLPMELQLAVWDFAAHAYPRVIAMKPEHEENYRPHAITHTCRASRDVIWQGLLLREAKRPYIFCDSKHDTVLLRNDGSNFKEFCKKGLKSIAVIYDTFGVNLTATDAKAFVGLQRIVVLIGKPRARCEMTLELISEHQPPRRQVCERNKARVPWLYAEFLREDMEKTAKKWKTYQRRRANQGKSSPDWIVPRVEVAYLRPVCETVSPYFT